MTLGRFDIGWSRNSPAAIILLFVVAGAPFPFGSTNDLSIAFWCLCLGIALMAVSTRSLRPPHFWLLAGISLIVASYGMLLHEQLSDHPWFAPPNAIWRRAADLLDAELPSSVSIVRAEPLFALGAPLANILALILGITIGAQRKPARRIVIVLAVSGAVYALYGVLSFFIEPTLILWRDKRAYLGSVTGTFINRNTAAAYFGSCAVIWLLLILDGVQKAFPGRRLTFQKLSLYVSEISPRQIVPQALAFLICLMAMFMTTSRAGVSISLFAMVVAGTVSLRKHLPPRFGLGIALSAGLIIVLVMLELFGGRVSSRFDSQGLVDEGRIEAWRSTLRIISDNPLWGTGLGTFRWSFPPYRSSSISTRGVWDAAHSTPLELASEVGLPLTALVSIGWIGMLVILIKGVLTRRWDGTVPLAGAVTAMLSLLHSVVDFTLQVPGYSIPFFVLFGAGLAQSFPCQGSSQ